MGKVGEKLEGLESYLGVASVGRETVGGGRAAAAGGRPRQSGGARRRWPGLGGSGRRGRADLGIKSGRDEVEVREAR